MPKGDNKTVINFTTELKQFADSKKGDLERSFHVALTYLDHYKDEFIEKYGQECYNAHVKRYSIPATELRDNSIKRKKENLAMKKRELELREKELAIKSKFLEAETTVMNDKHETAMSKAEEEAERERMKIPEYRALIREKKDINEWLERAKKEPDKPWYSPDKVEKMTAQLAEINLKIKNFEFEPQQAPHP